MDEEHFMGTISTIRVFHAVCSFLYAPEASVSHSSPPWVIRLRVRQGVEDVYIPIPVAYLGLSVRGCLNTASEASPKILLINYS